MLSRDAGFILSDRRATCHPTKPCRLGRTMTRDDAMRILGLDQGGELPGAVEEAHAARAPERFLAEGRIASGLSHPNIVRVYDVHQTAGLTFLTMERLRGRSLREEIARRQATAERFRPAEVLGIAGSLCGALHQAHRQT